MTLTLVPLFHSSAFCRLIAGNESEIRSCCQSGCVANDWMIFILILSRTGIAMHHWGFTSLTSSFVVIMEPFFSPFVSFYVAHMTTQSWLNKPDRVARRLPPFTSHRSPATQGTIHFDIRGDGKLTLIDCIVWEDFIHYLLSPYIHLARRASFLLTTSLFGRPFGKVTSPFIKDDVSQRSRLL